MHFADFKNYIIDFMKSAYPICSGTTVAQLIAMISVLFISRLYNPDQFGTFTIITTLAGFLGSVACLSFENVFLIDKSHKNMVNILAICIFLCSAFSISTWFILIVFSLIKHDNTLINTLVLNKEFISIYIFALGNYTILVSINFHFHQNRIVGYAKAVEPLVHHTLMIIFGIMQYSVKGMLYASFLGLIIGTIILSRSAYVHMKHIDAKKLNFKFMRIIFNKFSELPKIYFFTNIFINLNIVILTIAFGLMYNSWEIGLFSFAIRILRTPYFITKPLSGVFLNMLSAADNRIDKTNYIYIGILAKLIIFGICSIIVIMLMPDSLISFIFGNDWIGINYIMKICAVFTFLELMQNILLGVYLKINRQRLQLILCASHSLILSLLILFLFNSNTILVNIYQALYFVSAVNIVMLTTQLILPIFLKKTNETILFE